MDYARPDRRDRLDRLAAEYALGTLPPRPRARLARAARAEPAVANAVAEWHHRLVDLAVAMPGVTPPPRVWTRIAQRLGFAELRDAPAAAGWWERVALWRGLAALAFAAAIALGVALLAPQPGGVEAPIVAALAGPDGKTALLVSAHRREPFLLVKAVAAAPVEAGKTLELWMLPEGRPPRSLGVLPAAGVARVPLSAPAEGALENIPALAVSLEPAGGSSTGLPTGPVLYSGKIERMY
jgi:anti-sigma-K factor RskA